MNDRYAPMPEPQVLASPDPEPAVGHANPPSLAPIEGETAMPATEPEPAERLRTEDMPWIPTSPGKSFRPLRFDAGGWSELMRLEPGSLVARHRHTGHVHALTCRGLDGSWKPGRSSARATTSMRPLGWSMPGSPSVTVPASCISRSSVRSNISTPKTRSSTSPTPDLSAAPIWPGVSSTTPNRSPRSSGSPAGMKLCCRPALTSR